MADGDEQWGDTNATMQYDDKNNIAWSIAARVRPPAEVLAEGIEAVADYIETALSFDPHGADISFEVVVGPNNAD